MIGFTPGELAINRAGFTGDLPDLCTIQRASVASDSAGGQTTTWTPDGAAVACRVAPSQSATESPIGERTAGAQMFTVTFAHNVTPPAAADRISWDTAGRTLEVIGAGGRSQAYSRRVEAVEVI